MTKDKERDYAPIAEKERLADILEKKAGNAYYAITSVDLRQAAALLRGDEQPKPDRAFEREERYIVIKRKHLSEVSERHIFDVLNRHEVKAVEGVVIESDWPEYEPVWQMIERRVVGQPAPKPDRAEALAWMIEGLFAEAADNPCTCASDENSCPHCNAWERATKQTRACIVEAIDELRAEWEAERPAVVVPSEAKLWAESRLNKRSAVPLNYGGIAAQYILNGAKGGE